MFEAAAGTALSVIFLFLWIGVRRVVRFGMLVDLVCFVSLTWMFHGTYAGMMTGVLAALCVSCYLRLMRKFVYGKEQLVVLRGEGLPKFEWRRKA
jgi:hypothetical protein